MLKNLLKAVAKGVLFAICWWAGFALYHYLLHLLRPVSLHVFWQGFIFLPVFLLCPLPYYAAENKFKLSASKCKTWLERIIYLIFFMSVALGSFHLLQTALPQVSITMPRPSWPNTAYEILGVFTSVALPISAFFLYCKLRFRAQK